MSSDPEEERARIRARKLAELRERHGEAGSETESPARSTGSRAERTEPVHVDGRDDLDALLGAADVVLVDFYADWCGPCKMLEPVVEQLAAETPAAVATVDIDANRRLAEQFGVRSVPTLALFADGEQVEQLAGARGEAELRSLIDRYT
ncbi:MAG: thioredoxin [uncultured archaeon A07HB70]|nr:MAG: thioredoxin [uncultured archaeon A07HB70]